MLVGDITFLCNFSFLYKYTPNGVYFWTQSFYYLNNQSSKFTVIAEMFLTIKSWNTYLFSFDFCLALEFICGIKDA